MAGYSVDKFQLEIWEGITSAFIDSDGVMRPFTRSWIIKSLRHISKGDIDLLYLTLEQNGVEITVGISKKDRHESISDEKSGHPSWPRSNSVLLALQEESFSRPHSSFSSRIYSLPV